MPILGRVQLYLSVDLWPERIQELLAAAAPALGGSPPVLPLPGDPPTDRCPTGAWEWSGPETRLSTVISRGQASNPMDIPYDQVHTLEAPGGVVRVKVSNWQLRFNGANIDYENVHVEALVSAHEAMVEVLGQDYGPGSYPGTPYRVAQQILDVGRPDLARAFVAETVEAARASQFMSARQLLPYYQLGASFGLDVPEANSEPPDPPPPPLSQARALDLVRSGDVGAIRRLMVKGLNSAEQRWLVEAASKEGHLEVLDLLLSGEVPASSVLLAGVSAAIRGGQTEPVRRLVAAGARLEISAQSFVRSARACNDDAMLATLAELGVDVERGSQPVTRVPSGVSPRPRVRVRAPDPAKVARLASESQRQAIADAEEANRWTLSDSALVETVSAIARGGDTAGLGSAGFGWSAFESRLSLLRGMKVGFDGSLPVRIDASLTDRGAELERVLGDLRLDLLSLRKLAPLVMTEPEQIPGRLECTVPDGTSRFELGPANPREVFLVHLQDSPFVREELPHLARMTETRGLWLFGDELTSADLDCVPFETMRRLTVLDLGENRLEALPTLAHEGCRLEWLSLRANARLSEVLPGVQGLTSLRLLDLRHTAVDDAQLDALRDALPGCVVLA